MARDVRIGQILLRRGAIDAQRLESAERAARSAKRSLCSELLESGRCTESELVAALAEQQGFPGVDLGASVLELEALAPIPHRMAYSDKLLAMSRADGRLHVATPTPRKAAAELESLRFLAGRDVVIYVAVRTSIEGAIAAAYGARARGLGELRGANAPPRSAAPLLAVKEPAGEAAARPPATTPVAPPVATRAAPAPGKIAQAPAAKAPEVVGPGDVEFLSEAEAQPRTVLVVDDDEAVRTLAAKALAARGLAVAAAGDGESALQLARKHHPDLVLLDAMLPNIHGFEVARRLRADPATRGVGVVIMSAAHRGWRYAEDAKQRFGVLDYVEKPFRVDDLQRRVLAALQRVPRRAAAGAGGAPGPDVDELLQRSRELYVAGELDAAIDAYSEAAEAAPASAEAQLGLGRALARRDPFRAMFALERAIEVAPTLFPALRTLALLYLENGFSSKAAEALERAHAAAPDESQREAFRRDLLRFG